MKRKLLSILALLCLTASSALADWDGGTYTVTTWDEFLAAIEVTDDATLTINPGLTVTVDDGIVIADGKTLTITGGGKLEVNGASGADGEDGGDAISGNVIIIGGTVQATGGTGGYGANGGNAFAGTLTFYGGTVIASGGVCGEGGNYGFGFERSANFKIDSNYYTLKGGDNADPEDVIDVDAMWNYQYVTITAGNAVSGNCGTSGHESEVTWMLTADGKLTISGTGAMAGYEDANYQPWADKRDKIKSIVIGNGVTSIGNYAFSNCEYVTSPVTIPASVTSIGKYSFYFSTIPSFTFADGSALKTIDSYAFSCYSLSSISLPSSVTSIGSATFDGCTDLTVTLNSNPTIGKVDYQQPFGTDATVTMNLTANAGATGEYWTTFYNENYNFQASDGTQIFKAALSGTSLALTELDDNKIVDADNAVILKSTASPIVMTLTTTASGNNFSGNSLHGVQDPAGLTAADPSTTYVLNKKNDVVGFYKLKAGKTVGVGKAYLTYSGVTAPEFLGFDETTGVTNTNRTNSTNLGEVYDLQGRRVETSNLKSQTSNLKKGLYIVNGRKVVIK